MDLDVKGKSEPLNTSLQENILKIKAAKVNEILGKFKNKY